MYCRPFDINYIEDGLSTYHIWAKDPESNTILLRVHGFGQRLMIELPSFLVESGVNRSIRWSYEDNNQTDIHRAYMIHYSIVQKISFLDETNNPLLLPTQFHPDLFSYKHDLYYFSIKKKPYLEIIFRSVNALRKAARIITSENGLNIQDPNTRRFTNYKMFDLQVHENTVKPERKLLSYTGIKFASWTKFSGELITNESLKISIVPEYNVNWKTLELSEEDFGFPNYTTLSFDIECYSDNDNVFTNAQHPNHICYMITATHAINYEFIHKYGIVLGKCNEIDNENTTLISVDTEEDVVLEFAKIIQETNPDAITGYNIFGYDIPYIHTRLGFNGESWPIIGRLKDIKGELLHNEWSSGAYSYNEINMIKAPGRLYFDILPIIKRLFTRESSYSLRAMSSKLLNDNKLDVSYLEMFRTYELMDRALNSRNTNKELTKEATDKMTEVMLYCIRDSDLPIMLMEKLGLWTSSIEGASIMGVNVQVLDTGGQQRRSTSLIYDEAFKEGIVYNIKDSTPGLKFVGGKVLDPIKGLHYKVILVDFSSLYPTIIIHMNICYSTYIIESMWEKICNGEIEGITPDDCNEITVKYEEKVEVVIDGKKVKTIKAGTYTYRYVKEHIKKGIVPKMVEDLCNERTRIRTEQKKYKKGSQEWEILEKKQLACKVSCNSVYGLFGVKHGKLPLIEAGLSVTARGREMLTIIAEHAERVFGAKVVYGDTDSIMVVIPELKDKGYKECYEMGKELCKELTSLFPPPVNLDLDGIWEKALFITKKKYVALPMKEPGKELNRDVLPEDLYYKGVMSARRDNCRWAVDLYNNVLADIFNGKEFDQILYNIIKECKRLIYGEVDYEDLVMTKKMGENYKTTCTAPMKLFSEIMEEIGKPIQPGTRIEYLIRQFEDQYRYVEKDGRYIRRINIDYKQGERMILKDEFEANNVLPDIPYYLNFPTNHIDQVLEVLIDKEEVRGTRYLERGCTNVLYSNTPMKYINRLFQYGRSIPPDVEELEDLIRMRLDRYNKLKELSPIQQALYDELLN